MFSANEKKIRNRFHFSRCGHQPIEEDTIFHSLRHIFATHLLEKGIDIRYIKDLLGYFDIRMTERYLPVHRDKLITIVSQLDDLWKSETDR